MRTLVVIMIYLAICTTSFDVFLAYDAGMTIRFTQIILIIPMIYMVILALIRKKLYIPCAFRWIAIWCGFMLLFVLNTTYMERSVGYWLWLAFSLFMVLLLVNLFLTQKSLITLLKVYIYSFFFVALFGLVQFFSAPILGLNTPLVTQWWIPGLLARINAFSYEPSYFVTYLLIGWTIVYVLWRKNNEVVLSASTIKVVLFIETLAIILSSSRIGLLMMLLIVCVHPVRITISFVRTAIAEQRLELQSIKKILVVVCVCGGLGSLIVGTGIDFGEYDFLLSGTGAFGASAHSVDDRLAWASRTYDVFIENPFVGVSLGGIPEHVMQAENIIGNVKDAEGASIFVEVLAASGVIGVIPFIIYFVSLFRQAWRLAISRRDGVLFSLILALVVEFILLQFNQNILRPYVWMHIAILSVWYQYSKYNYCEKRGAIYALSGSEK